MGASSAPEFPYPGGTQGAEPADPVAGKPGHFAWSRWIKEFVKRLDQQSVKRSGDTIEGTLTMKSGVNESQISATSSGLNVNSRVTALSPTASGHLATKQYVDTRIPPYLQVSITADGTGWATPTGLPAGAIVTSLLDVSSTPTTNQMLLNTTNNKIYIGPSATRTVRIWYVV